MSSALSARAHTVTSRVLSKWFPCGWALGRRGSAGLTPRCAAGGLEKYYQLWFKGGPELDAELKRDFSEDIDAVGSGELDMMGSREGRLASVILLDQFTRNVFRDSADMYKWDERALGIARTAIEQGDDVELGYPKGFFFYLPFEHSESKEVQAESVALFEKAVARTAEEPEVSGSGARCRTRALTARRQGIRKMAAAFLDFAKQHKRDVDKFGRFPHRNRLLGRATTAEEEEYLREGGGY